MPRILTAGLVALLLLTAAPARLHADEPEAGAPKAAVPAERPLANAEDPLAIPPMFESLFPERIRHLKEVSLTHPQMYQSAVRKMRELAAELDLLKHSNLDEYDRHVRALKLESEAEALTAKWRATKDPAAKARLETALRTKLEALLDMKDAQLQHSIALQEAELTKLKQRLEKRKAARQTLIDKRLREIKEQDDDLDF